MPTFTAFAVTQLLEDHFHDLVDLQFTAYMEQELDEIAEGDVDWLTYLRNFYLGEDGLDNQVRTKEGAIDPRDAGTVELENLSTEVRIGQYGPYVAVEENGDRITVGLPPDLPPADLTDEMVAELVAKKSDGPRELGTDPDSGKEVLLKVGPYGPYVQLGQRRGKGKAEAGESAEGNGPGDGEPGRGLAVAEPAADAG